ncbi:unnamed protein product [Ixodes persulcatus]
MDLKALRKPDLESICLEMGIDIAGLKRKPLIMDAIHRSGADGDELQECWEFIQEREKKRAGGRKETRGKRKGAERLARANGKPSSVGQQGWKMKNLLQPYRVGEDIGLFLVNFERACERASFSGVVASAPLDVVAV